MRINRKDLDWAASQGHLEPDRVEGLWRALEERSQSTGFTPTNLAYYLGAMIVIASMGWLLNRAWEQFGGFALMSLALLYAIAFLTTGWKLWTSGKPAEQIPGGLLATLAVGLVPLAIHGFQRGMNWWPPPGTMRNYYELGSGNYLAMELGAILAAAGVVLVIRFPLVVAPAVYAGWILSLDVTRRLFGLNGYLYRHEEYASLVYGMLLLGVGYLIDRRTRADFSFWYYVFGLVPFWGGLSALQGQGEGSWMIYCAINVALLLVAIFLERPLFAIFGVVGVNVYLIHLALKLFRDSFLFPVALVCLGVLIMVAGMMYQRRRQEVQEMFARWIPQSLQALRPVHRHS